MFGDLFGEEDDASFHGTQTSGCRSSGNAALQQPPLPRGASGIAGIANQGATCYLNSLLQTMLFTPEFRECLFELGQDELGNIADKDKQGFKVRVIPIHLQRLFASLLLLNKQSATTVELTDSFGWTNNEELQQHDVQELSRILFCAIEDSLVGTSGQQLISQLYRGTIVNQITCEECNRVSERLEDFLDLTLAVGGFVGVRDTLRACYTEEERMEGSNQYRCDGCRKLVNARKGAKLRSLPPILTLSLLRFSYDFAKLERYKETGHYTFPTELDMAPYCEHGQEGRETVYELYSVVLHSGSTYGGHYHAYIRDIDNLGTWSEPENELIQLTPDPGSGKDDIIDMKSPQQCLSALLRKHGGPEHVLTIERLCQVLTQETGVSWNKRFKRQFGTLTKFLRKYNNLFELNKAATLVHLVDPTKSSSRGPATQRVASSLSASRSPSQEGAVSPESFPRKGSGEGDGIGSKANEQDQSNREKAIARATSSIPEPGRCWYDFNDSRVQPIRESALNRQFQGRESAYMLLYRRKTQQRPQDAFKNPCYKMPEWLVEEMNTANCELEKEREEYERQINAVEVSIHLSSQYQWARGALQPSPPGSEPVKITLDRRRTVSVLMEMICDRVPSINAQNMCLHKAKELPAGIHLYESISADMDKSLQDHYVTNGGALFLWDGKQVGGASVVTGDQCEPLLLIVTHDATLMKHKKTQNSQGHHISSLLTEKSDNVMESPYGIPKDMKLSELRCMISDIVNIPTARLLLSRVQDSNPVILSQDDDARTVLQLGFSDGDKLVAEDKGSTGNEGDSLAVQEAERQKGNIRLGVENRCVEPNDEGDWPIIQLYIPKGKTVSALKQVIINKFGLYGNARPREGCRLRISDNALGLLPPLHENESLSDAGIKQGKCIVIETGLPPTTNEVTIYFRLTTGSKSWDIIIDKNKAATECLTAMLETAGLQGHPHHLRKTNWCNEPTSIITDMEQSLAQLNVRDGELLVLEEGRLPPKGFILLPIWLYPPPNKGASSGVQGEGEGEGVTSWTSQFSNMVSSFTSAFTSQDVQDSPSQPSPNCQDSAQSEWPAHGKLLGEIEVSQNASVSDLKGLVMTLPAMSATVVPTTCFMRLRMLEDGRLGRVLRINNQNLKYARIVSSSQIAVQILSEEEQLKQNEYVLAVQRRIPGTRTYAPQEELVWDAGKFGAPCSLRQAIADCLLLHPEQIRIAKHLPHKHEWLVIPEDTQVQAHISNDCRGRGRGRGGGRGTRGKTQHSKPANLKQAPYNIRDGDVFGVVDLREDSLRQDDFMTEEDEEGKRKKQEEEEQKRTRRQERRNAISVEGKGVGKERRKREEVGLKIRVDDFR